MTPSVSALSAPCGRGFGPKSGGGGTTQAPPACPGVGILPPRHRPAPISLKALLADSFEVFDEGEADLLLPHFVALLVEGRPADQVRMKPHILVAPPLVQCPCPDVVDAHAETNPSVSPGRDQTLCLRQQLGADSLRLPVGMDRYVLQVGTAPLRSGMWASSWGMSSSARGRMVVTRHRPPYSALGRRSGPAAGRSRWLRSGCPSPSSPRGRPRRRDRAGQVASAPRLKPTKSITRSST